MSSRTSDPTFAVMSVDMYTPTPAPTPAPAPASISASITASARVATLGRTPPLAACVAVEALSPLVARQ